MDRRRDPLRTLLDRFNPIDATESAHLSRMRDLLDAAGDPFSRDHYVPGHFTASAFIATPDRSALLLIYHGKLHRWLQPGGHVDPADPDVIATARRETAEEVGLSDLPLVGDGILDVDVHRIPARKAEPAHEHFDVRFLFTATGTTVTAATDAVDARWVPMSEIDAEVSDESVMRAVRKIRMTA
jgi:8-oxo-dGTP pyrophosphatase MutT (NUDIX family)